MNDEKSKAYSKQQFYSEFNKIKDQKIKDYVNEVFYVDPGYAIALSHLDEDSLNKILQKSELEYPVTRLYETVKHNFAERDIEDISLIFQKNMVYYDLLDNLRGKPNKQALQSAYDKFRKVYGFGDSEYICHHNVDNADTLKNFRSLIGGKLIAIKRSDKTRLTDLFKQIDKPDLYKISSYKVILEIYKQKLSKIQSYKAGGFFNNTPLNKIKTLLDDAIAECDDNFDSMINEPNKTLEFDATEELIKQLQAGKQDKLGKEIYNGITTVLERSFELELDNNGRLVPIWEHIDVNPNQ